MTRAGYIDNSELQFYRWIRKATNIIFGFECLYSEALLCQLSFSSLLLPNIGSRNHSSIGCHRQIPTGPLEQNNATSRVNGRGGEATSRQVSANARSPYEANASSGKESGAVHTGLLQGDVRSEYCAQLRTEMPRKPGAHRQTHPK